MEKYGDGICLFDPVTGDAGVTPAVANLMQRFFVVGTTVCPQRTGNAAGAGRAPAVVPSPAQLAAEFWYQIHLPVPRPSSRPDYATTGKTTYLEPGDTDAPPVYRRATPRGELTIVARGTYTVLWGDGTPRTGPYATPGGPYPDGTITHTYDTTGHVRITVEETWTATWTIGAAHGTLDGLHTTGVLPDFPVRQIQAVING